jgi:hypothetical protein
MSILRQTLESGGEHGRFFRINPPEHEIAHLEATEWGRSGWLLPAVCGADIDSKGLLEGAMRAAMATYGAFGLEQMRELSLDELPWFFEELEKLMPKREQDEQGN